MFKWFRFRRGLWFTLYLTISIFLVSQVVQTLLSSSQPVFNTLHPNSHVYFIKNQANIITQRIPRQKTLFENLFHIQHNLTSEAVLEATPKHLQWTHGGHNQSRQHGLTIFSTLRWPLTNRTVNALNSWARLRPRPEIIIFTEEGETEELSRFLSSLDVIQAPISHRSGKHNNRPLVSGLFEDTRRLASNRLLLYANADIIFFNDMMKAAAFVAHSQVSWRPFSPLFGQATRRYDFLNEPFLVVGRRWNLTLPQAIDFDDPNWEAQVKHKLHSTGTLENGYWIDYFLFPKELNITLLPFVVGQPMWDSWFMHTVRSSGIPVVDITRVTTVIHQGHPRNWTWRSSIAKDMKRMAEYYLTYAHLETANIALDFCTEMLCAHEYRFFKPFPLDALSAASLPSRIPILVICTVLFIILLLYRCRRHCQKNVYLHYGINLLLGLAVTSFLLTFYFVWLELGRVLDLFFSSLSASLVHLTQRNINFLLF